LGLLKWGLLMLRESAFAGRTDLCRIESDHLHNIPTLLGEVNELRHVYYIEKKRGLYLNGSRNQGPANTWMMPSGVIRSSGMPLPPPLVCG